MDVCVPVQIPCDGVCSAGQMEKGRGEGAYGLVSRHSIEVAGDVGDW